MERGLALDPGPDDLHNPEPVYKGSVLTVAGNADRIADV